MNSAHPSKTDRWAVSLGHLVTNHPYLVMTFTLMLLGVTATGVQHLSFSNNYRTFFSPDNPELITFDRFQDTYTKNDNFLFVVHPKGGKVFTPRIAQAIEELTKAAWNIPYTLRVDSVSNFQHSWAKGDDLTVDDLIRNGKSLSSEALAAKRQVALDEPLLNGQLIAPDAHSTGVNVTLQYPEQSLTEVPSAVSVARSIVDDIEARYPDIHVALTGISMLNNAFSESGQADAMTLIPFMYLALLVTMALVLRSFWGTLATLLVIAFSTVTAMGVAGYLGYTLDPISLTAPTIILTLAVADSVHLLVSMLSLLREGHSKQSAVVESLRINFLAISITSVTTLVGFLALNFSDSPPFWYLGNITAIGIVAAWIYSLLFLPAFLSVVPIRARQKKTADRNNKRMAAFAGFVTRNYRSVLFISLAAAAASMSFLPRIQLDDQWVKYFDERMEFRQDADFAMQDLTGLYLIEFSIPAQEEGGVSEPEYLANLKSFTEWLRSEPDVMHVYSYSDIIQRLNKNLHGDDPEWYRIPDKRELAAQYLLLYELSLPYGLDLNDRINVDKSATRVTVTIKELSTTETRAFLERSKRWLKNNVPTYMASEPTGATVMFSFISQRNIENMLTGNALAVALIAIILMLSLRSAGLGLMSLIPNTIPILMAFGLWGLLVGKVGMAAATVSATSLGIIVDNTVHFLTKYLRARREQSAEIPEAITYAFQTVGTAVLLNALILAAGFLVLTNSTFKVNEEMGLLTAMAIVIALIVDFFLLPALLMLGHRKNQGDRNEDKDLAYVTD
ncbi:Probable integral membrane protein [hydrothermal vent metagenome]|uniref:Probable integral membrane protein n=1 Tax=hydrothermal vent metagenome TaxID=652676 RepID=A0A3B0YIV3_9ZZZZ